MKKWIILAVVLVIVGGVLCFSSASSMRFDLRTLDNSSYQTNTYAVEESFQSIRVDASVEKIALRPAEDGKCKVVCFEKENMKHEVGVLDGTLTIRSVDRQRSFSLMSFNLKPQEITVYLPDRVYSELRIETGTGDVELPADFSFDSIAIKGSTADVSCLASAKDGIEIDLSTGHISLSGVTAGSIGLKTTTGKIGAESVNCEGDVLVRVDTGDVKLRDMTCGNLTSEGSTGDITLDAVVAADTISIVRSTGKVELLASDADSLFVETSTGDVKGSLLSEKVFLTETNTGKIDVPKSVTGGRSEITTSTGDIKITVG